MHEKVAKLVIERATVIFNLLARHLTRWSCRASERYNVLARTGPAVWKVRRASGPVLMLRAAMVLQNIVLCRYEMILILHKFTREEAGRQLTNLTVLL